jgi:hypothetical protein
LKQIKELFHNISVSTDRVDILFFPLDAQIVTAQVKAFAARNPETVCGDLLEVWDKHCKDNAITNRIPEMIY